jgi:hypothetical protein
MDEEDRQLTRTLTFLRIRKGWWKISETWTIVFELFGKWQLGLPYYKGNGIMDSESSDLNKSVLMNIDSP